MKVKSFCTAEEIIKTMTRQPTDQEEIYANDETDKGLVSKTDKELRLLNIKKPTPSKNGWVLHQRVSKADTQMATGSWEHAQHFQLLEKYKSNYKKYQCTLVRMAIIKKSTKNKCWRGCREKGTLPHYYY